MRNASASDEWIVQADQTNAGAWCCCGRGLFGVVRDCVRIVGRHEGFIDDHAFGSEAIGEVFIDDQAIGSEAIGEVFIDDHVINEGFSHATRSNVAVRLVEEEGHP